MGDDVAGELFGVSGVVFEVSVIGHACSRVVDIANKGVGVVLAAKGVNVVVELCFAIFIGGEWDKEEDNEDQDDEDDNCNKEDSKLIFFVASIPFITGMAMSMRITSGFFEEMKSTAFLPLSTSPIISMSGNVLRL